MEKPFVKIELHSGVGGEPLGEKDLAVYYECNTNVKKVADTDILSYDDELLEWVNTSDRFKKGYFNEAFEFNRQPFELVFLNDDQIKRVQDAGHLIHKNDLKQLKNRRRDDVQ